MLNTKKGLIVWFARNPVAANLLMLIIVVGGLLTANTIRKQFFPQVDINWIKFSASYPGAAPKEVEEGITIKVEEALESVQGLNRIITNSNQNIATGHFRVEDDYDPQVLLEEIKSQIDSISSFPEGMERPKVERIKLRQEVLYISLYGDLTPRQLKELGDKIHEQIRLLPGGNISEFYGGLDYEIAIEVSKDKLREFGLSFIHIANAIRGFSQNMSTWQIRAENGYINLRVQNQAYVGSEFADLPLITLSDGSKILLGDIATVSDDFEQGIQYSKFNGKNSVTIFVGATNNQSITDVAQVVKNYVQDKQQYLPEGVKLETWVDMTYYLQGRLDLMLDSMKSQQLQVEQLLGQVVLAQEEERNRISIDLHDSVAQWLVAVSYGIQTFRHALPEKKVEKARSELGDMESTITKSLKELRRVVVGLRPPALDELGLTHAIRQSLDDLTTDGIVCNFNRSGQPFRLPSSLEIAVYRVVQEAMTNVRKHAGATKVWLNVEFHEDELMVEIRDNGQGFNLAQTLDSAISVGRLGLLGMKQRTEMLGGDMNIRTSEGHGTDITFSFPVLSRKEE